MSTKPWTLQNLFSQYDGTGYGIKDKGPGCAFDGQFIRTDKLPRKLGRVEMHVLPKPVNFDGVNQYTFASKWQVSSNGYKYRLFF